MNVFFFFSSRRRHTRLTCDWSSDVCSSDLPRPETGPGVSDRRYRQPLPLGGEDGLPFSKGLMARALIAAGLSADRAYELALAVEADLAASERQATTMERLEEVAVETLGQ